jgi:hypothetical protein
MNVTPLSEAHVGQLALAVERARAQWVPRLEAPRDVVVGLERVLLFLRQNGSPSKQARQVASLAFLFGAQVVAGSDWRWASVCEDDGVNPSLVSADGRWACCLVDVATTLVMERRGVTLLGLYEGLLAHACEGLQTQGLLTALAG